MSIARIQSLKIKAKLLQKAKRKAGKPIRLKDAFTQLATSAGFSSWRHFKASIDAHEAHDALCPPGQSAFWKVWYSSYEDAARHLQEHGGFLLPYQKDFFICDVNYIEFLGIPADDADLRKAGFDWARPKDARALERLLRRINARK